MLLIPVQRLPLGSLRIILIVASSACAQAQGVVPRPSFDVASIKASTSTAYWASVAPLKNGRLSAANVTVKQLLAIAYTIDPSRISGGPQWLDLDRFNVEAKVEVPPPDTDLPVMLQSLLADRFQLKVHNEAKTASGYALVNGRNGSKLQPVGHRDCPMEAQSQAGCSGVRFAGRGLTAEYVSMPAFVRFLSRMLGTSILDETGLSGSFDFTLDWIRDEAEGASTPATSSDWIFSALPRQLGLRLESRKTLTEMLVIDDIRRPTAN